MANPLEMKTRPLARTRCVHARVPAILLAIFILT